MRGVLRIVMDSLDVRDSHFAQDGKEAIEIIQISVRYFEGCRRRYRLRNLGRTHARYRRPHAPELDLPIKSFFGPVCSRRYDQWHGRSSLPDNGA